MELLTPEDIPQNVHKMHQDQTEDENRTDVATPPWASLPFGHEMRLQEAYI